MNPNPLGKSRPRPGQFRGRTFFLTERDTKILHFLWRWKLASTATLHEAIGRPLSPYSTFKALERLERSGHVESRVSQQHGFASWQLTERGFESIREGLGDLAEEGFLSENYWHDRNALAFHLGEWTSYPIPQVTHFTEQELRRRSPEDYPEWVPKLQGRRPDGYTRIATGQKSWVLALEVELSAKNISRYESILRSYRSCRQIDQVLWLVDDPQVREQIRGARACLRDEGAALLGARGLEKRFSWHSRLGKNSHLKMTARPKLRTVSKSDCRPRMRMRLG